MTYAEKLAIEYSGRLSSHDEKNNILCLKNAIEEALQAQREADIEAIMSLKKVHGAMFFIEEVEHLQSTLEAFKQAILTAEVKL